MTRNEWSNMMWLGWFTDRATGIYVMVYPVFMAAVHILGVLEHHRKGQD